MGCSKGVCCKWTYISLSIFVFLLGFLAFAPMYVTGPPGACVDNDTTDVCQCQPWDEDCDEPEEDCITTECLSMDKCCEEDGGTWEVSTSNGFLLNIHGLGYTCHQSDDWDSADDATNSWKKQCALGGPDKTQPASTWMGTWNGYKRCMHFLQSEEDDCDWDAGKDTCVCTDWLAVRGEKDNDCNYEGCVESNYVCTCDDVDCELEEGDTPDSCDDCVPSDGDVRDCNLAMVNGDSCLDWGEERSDATDCMEGMEDYCPGSAVDFCEDKKKVFAGFFQAFVLFILAQVVLALAAVLSVLSICTSKINCLKGCFTKFARLIIGFALLGGSVFASAAFALFDLKGVQSWATLINQDGEFDTSFTLCSGQPGVLVENTTMAGVATGMCLKRTNAFYLYVLLVVTLSWTACLAAFATVCCCNPEKAADEANNEVVMERDE